ncbi:hypothetical protein DMENIID0001_026750 [Sergentomyia squamirostris]
MNKSTFQRRYTKAQQDFKNMLNVKRRLQLSFLLMERAVKDYLTAVENSDLEDKDKAVTKRKMLHFLQKNKHIGI